MSTNASSTLKRKNEELDLSQDDQLNKRVALDSEQVELSEKQEEDAHTAPAIYDGHQTQEENEVENGEEHIENGDDVEKESEDDQFEAKSSVDEPESAAATSNDAAYDAETVLENITAAAAAAAAASAAASAGSNHNIVNTADAYQDSNESKPISNHREKEGDPTYVSFRMYCPVKEASAIVGKKGEKINHIRDKAGVRINVSENLKNVPERIVLVRGPAENVARAFGLIARTILEEPEDEPASMMSKPYDLKLLVPHPMVGYIIGRQGTKFREIEEQSAAKLKAAEQPLPYSTDRILSITGVGDAIHIAIYYISQVFIEHKDCLKKNKVIYYNPANYQHGQQPQQFGGVGQNQPLQQQQQQPPIQQQQYHHSAPGGGPQGMVPGGQMNHQSPYNNNPNYSQLNTNPGNPYQQQQQHQQNKQPYNFQMMFQPAVHPQQYGAPVPNPATQMGGPPPGAVPQTQYTDEHGNTIIGDVITNPPVPAGGNPDKFNEDIYVANVNIGSVIGKGGNNIKQIRLNSGCTYVKIEPDQRQSIMLGGGKGLTSIRKLTLTGSIQAINTAIYLINQRIAVDKERNSH